MLVVFVLELLDLVESIVSVGRLWNDLLKYYDDDDFFCYYLFDEENKGELQLACLMV